ncbi:hypothetical protein Tco_0220417, partial [Tanacetum coccineum]
EEEEILMVDGYYVLYGGKSHDVMAMVPGMVKVKK